MRKQYKLDTIVEDYEPNEVVAKSQTLCSKFSGSLSHTQTNKHLSLSLGATEVLPRGCDG